MAATAPVATAAKLKSVLELGGQVPANDKEQKVWDLASEHENNLRNSGELYDNPELEAYLESLVENMMGEELEQANLSIDFMIVKRPSLSAWVYPYGTIAVHTGLLANLENEAQLAAILSHEVAHFIHRHSYREMMLEKKQSLIGQGIGLLATAAAASQTGAIDTSLMKAGSFYTELVTNGYSRKLEYQADKDGLEYMRHANYARSESVAAFTALQQNTAYGTTNMGSLWSSHPKLENRIKSLQKAVKKEKKKKVPPGEIPPSTPYYQAVAPTMLINAQLDMSEHQFDRARHVLAKYQKIFPDDPAVHFFLGECIRKENPDGPDYNPRIAAYQTALLHAPDFAEAHKELGMAYRRQGNDPGRR